MISLDGQIYVAGGATAQGTSRTVFRFDPATSRLSVNDDISHRVCVVDPAPPDSPVVTYAPTMG